MPGMPVVDAYNEGVRRQKIGDLKGAVRAMHHQLRHGCLAVVWGEGVRE